MLVLAADFWPRFWLIMGTGAALTVALSLVIALVPPPWTRHHRPTPAGPPPWHPEQLAAGQDDSASRRPAHTS